LGFLKLIAFDDFILGNLFGAAGAGFLVLNGCVADTVQVIELDILICCAGIKLNWYIEYIASKQ